MKALNWIIIRFCISFFFWFFVSTPLLIFPSRLYYGFLFPIFNWFYLISTKIKVHDLSKKKIEHKPPVLYASNHKAFTDFCTIASFFRKPFTVLIKEEMIYNPLFKFFAWKMKLIPIKRDNPLSQIKALERSKKILIKNRYSIILFPEGWYNFDKPVGKLKGGISKLAKETGVDVVPIAIYGIKNTFINEKKLLWKNVYIKSGNSIKYSDYNDEKTFLDDLENRIKNLYLEIEQQIDNNK